PVPHAGADRRADAVPDDHRGAGRAGERERHRPGERHGSPWERHARGDAAPDRRADAPAHAGAADHARRGGARDVAAEGHLHPLQLTRSTRVFRMGDLEFWFIARITGLTAFAVLSLSVLSGEALRTSVLDFLATNRAIRKLHDFTTPLWLPLAVAHVVALVFDRTARIHAVDLFVPFLTDYGQLAIGLGTISLDIILVVTVTSWLRSHMNNIAWTWIHRTSY